MEQIAARPSKLKTMQATKQYNLPITGMTCANCVSTVERNLIKVPGVLSASVNLSSERAAVEFDPAQANLPAMLARIRRAGYDVASGEADLLIEHLADGNDARRLEGALQKLDGVLEAKVNVTQLQHELAENEHQLCELEVILADYNEERTRLVRDISRLQTRLRDVEEQV